ncbi:MAG: potassium channel family protein [Bacteriovoracia bacterium]
MQPHHGIKIGMSEFGHWLKRLFSQPLFLFVTIWGHLAIFIGAAMFRHFENGLHPNSISLFDAYYWAISTATTVGTANMAPVSLGGKIVAIGVMITGSLFLWSYTALFAASVVLPSFREIERDIRLDTATIQKLLKELEKMNASSGPRK